jgi:hypothetical protein
MADLGAVSHDTPQRVAACQEVIANRHHVGDILAGNTETERHAQSAGAQRQRQS